MPNLAQFEQDYWAPDREEVLAQMRAANQQNDLLRGANEGWYRPGGNINSGGTPQFQPAGQQQSYQPFNEQALSQAWLSSGGHTPQDLANFFSQHPELTQGATLVGSKKDKIQLPDGRVVDAVLASGEGGRGAQWLVDDGRGGGGQSGGYGFGQAPNPTPFNYEQFKAPGAFQYEGFKAPDQLTLENDPGYQARLKLGSDALERSAAAKGTLLTGGTLKDLNQFAQDYGSNEFQNVFNRSLQDYGTNRGNAFQNYQTNYQNALDAYKTNFDTQFKPWEANYQQAYNSWLGNFNAANQGFQNQLASENQRFGQLYNTASLGLQGTNQAAGYGNSYANQMAGILGGQSNQAGDLITGQGNANAAGQVGAANAWNQGWGNAGNAATMAAMYGGLYGRQGKPAGGSTTDTDWQKFYGI